MIKIQEIKKKDKPIEEVCIVKYTLWSLNVNVNYFRESIERSFGIC